MNLKQRIALFFAKVFIPTTEQSVKNLVKVRAQMHVRCQILATEELSKKNKVIELEQEIKSLDKQWHESNDITNVLSDTLTEHRKDNNDD